MKTGFTIGLTLLLAGEVWAGDEMCVEAKNGKIVERAPCSEIYARIEKERQPSVPSCHQRMQEAMKAMDKKIQDDPIGITVRQNEAGGYSLHLTPTTDLWKRTMHDCVTK